MKASERPGRAIRLCGLALLGLALLVTASAAPAAAGGTPVAWGCHEGADWGQCAVSDLSDVTAIAGGYSHTLVLRGDGTVVARGCGFFDYGQCSVPAALSGVTAVAAGPFDSLALKSDGTVVGWGCGVGNNFLPVRRAGGPLRRDRDRGRRVP